MEATYGWKRRSVRVAMDRTNLTCEFDGNNKVTWGKPLAESKLIWDDRVEFRESRSMSIVERVPEIRIRNVGASAASRDGEYVLYWMTAFRRTEWNFSLQRAVEWAQELKKPLVVFEALRSGYPWACDRFHQFVIQGMADNAKRLARRSVLYYPYLEPTPGAGKGLLAALAKKACAVISDDFPCFFLPHMVEAARKQVATRFELIDSNGLFPMRATETVFGRAFDFRRFLQKNLRPHLDELPEPDPLAEVRLAKPVELPAALTRQWPAADVATLADDHRHLASFPFNHQVKVTTSRGGATTAQARLQEFLDQKLRRYRDERNQPQQEVASGLSPYLHFGHISVAQVFAETTIRDEWTPRKISEKVTGSSEGWWGTSPDVESFFDELITWREVGFNFCAHRSDFDQYSSLPDWAQRTLAKHADDKRAYLYSLEQLEASETHDELWNAAQRQLVREGRIHNYLRMLWGKLSLIHI